MLYRALFVLAIVMPLASVPARAQDGSQSLRAAVDTAVAAVKPSLVRIHVVWTEYSEGREMKFEASGSGSIITPEGHVATNHHVAGHGTRIHCTLSTKEEIDAELVGTDAATDIAVIKLLPKDGRTFPVAKWGDSAAVTVGDVVLAMGSPLSLSQSVTQGIVSNTEMVMPERMFGRFEQDGENIGALVRWIGHDAAIFPGNSGGPLVNLRGEIVGVNEIGIGLGGAIPANVAQGVAKALIQEGRVKRSWVGVAVRPLLKHGPTDRGVLVTDAIEGAPAAEAGIVSGDILLSLNGTPVTAKFEEELPSFNQLIAGIPIGQTVDAVVWREGAEKTVSMKTTEREDALPQQHELKQWGITVRDISYVMSKEMKRDNRDGVVVTSVRPGGPAGEAKPDIQEGDVIVQVGDKKIKNVVELRALTDAITKDATEPVPTLTTFDRKAGTMVSVVKVGIKELDDPGLEVKKAWLPVETQVITREVAEGIGKADLTGFRVTQVYPGTTAETAGLKVGDLLVAVDGEALTASMPEHYEELPALIRNYSVGAVADISVIRAGETVKVPVELVRAPMLDREMKKYRDEDFGFTARDVTFFDRANERWKQEQKGVLVEEVESGSWTALGGLGVNDLITELDGKAIENVETAKAAMDAVMAEKPESVVFKVRRGIYTLYLEMEPRWDDA